MYIQDALKPTGRAWNSVWAEKGYVVKNGNRFTYHHVKSGDIVAYDFCNILNDNWQPYHPKEEIRPSEAGELWEYNGDELYSAHFHHTKLDEDKTVCVVGDNGICGQISGMLHNQNGWKRLHPPVNDEEVNETLVFKDVEWSRYRDECIAPMLATGLPDSLINKPRMTMTLTIPKENS